MSKGLEALHSLYDTMPLAFEETHSVKYFENIEKELKALEIIKKKDIDAGFLAGCYLLEKGIDFYNANRHKKITKEEYDLLKEILL